MVIIFPLLFVFLALFFYFLPISVSRFIRKSPFIFTVFEWRFFKGVVMLFVVSMLGIIALWVMDKRHVEKINQLEAIKNHNRYFTIQQETAYGEIILPVGTHVAKFIPDRLASNLPKDLNDIEALRFPQPMMINGISVSAISPKYNYLELAQDFEFFDEQLNQTTQCTKGQMLYYFAYNMDNLAQDFKPSEWEYNHCIDYGYGITPPFWQNNRLYDPKSKTYIQ